MFAVLLGREGWVGNACGGSETGDEAGRFIVAVEFADRGTAEFELVDHHIAHDTSVGMGERGDKANAGEVEWLFKWSDGILLGFRFQEIIRDGNVGLMWCQSLVICYLLAIATNLPDSCPKANTFPTSSESP